MKTSTLAAAAALALTVATVSASPPAPAFHPLAGAKKSAPGKKDGAVMRSPQTQTIAAPVVSETRAVIAADGRLEIRCREVPNQRQHGPDGHAIPGPQR